MDYRRAWHKGGTYFFTVNLLQRRDNHLLIDHIDVLRSVVKKVKSNHPFVIHAWVVLPDHLHCVIELPNNDADFATRWRLIKSGFLKPYLILNTALILGLSEGSEVFGKGVIGSI